MPRRRKRGRVRFRFGRVCYKPCGIPANRLESVILTHDEMEAIRLADLEGLYQQDASELMQISRPTFSRLLERAHRKVADALINSKAIELEEWPETRESGEEQDE